MILNKYVLFSNSFMDSAYKLRNTLLFLMFSLGNSKIRIVVPDYV